MVSENFFPQDFRVICFIRVDSTFKVLSISVLFETRGLILWDAQLGVTSQVEECTKFF